MLPMMPSSIYSLASSVRDSNDQEILSPYCHAPLLQSNPDDDDVSEHGMPSPQAIWALPPHTVQLMLPNHIHPTFPWCTPSMPATSQESPEVCSMIYEVTFNETCFRWFPSTQRLWNIAIRKPWKVRSQILLSTMHYTDSLIWKCTKYRNWCSRNVELWWTLYLELNEWYLVFIYRWLEQFRNAVVHHCLGHIPSPVACLICLHHTVTFMAVSYLHMPWGDIHTRQLLPVYTRMTNDYGTV